MAFLVPRYDPLVVAASFLIASFAAYVALDLARRVRSQDRISALTWWAGGSLAMGTGIWSMHFVGMRAFLLPIHLGYTGALTLLSWLAGVAVSAIALRVASRPRLTWHGLAGGALAAGAGICSMHYIGMAALDMAPGIVWDPWLVMASAVIAVSASAATLIIFSWLRTLSRHQQRHWQVLAALAMGAAICGMHYTGMAAAAFPVGSVCLSADQLSGDGLAGVVLIASVLLLSVTLFTSVLDARLEAKAQHLSGSLQAANQQLKLANAELQRRSFEDPLTGLPNR
jgi:NO-binding membrane sensor protein with MHYT domain